MFNKSPPVETAITLRILAALLGYPNAEMRGFLPEMRGLLQRERALSRGRVAEVVALIASLERADSFAAIDIEADYVQTFDRGRATSLHLFEHVHGDSRERGPAMIDLAQTYANAGLILSPNELPDYLPAVLEFVSTLAPKDARLFLGEIAHILKVIFTALQQRKLAYASVVGALLDLAGEKAEAVAIPAEPSMDEAWEEPRVFDGCSTAGQSKPGQPQPIHIVRKSRGTGATA